MVCSNNVAAASVLSFNEDAEQLRKWNEELASAGVCVATATSPADVRYRLATESFALAVLDASAHARADEPVDRWAFFSGVRPRIIWVTRDFSSLTVLTLSEEGDLVLPHPLSPGTLLRALKARAQLIDAPSVPCSPPRAKSAYNFRTTLTFGA